MTAFDLSLIIRSWGRSFQGSLFTDCFALGDKPSLGDRSNDAAEKWGSVLQPPGACVLPITSCHIVPAQMVYDSLAVHIRGDCVGHCARVDS